MLETRAVVVSVHSHGALVQADQGNGCGQCNGKGCGVGKLSQMFCDKPRQFQVDNPINARVGDEVIVSVADGAVLRGIGLLYGLPLLLLIVAASLGSTLGSEDGHSDGYAAIGALVGLVGGFILARLISSRLGRGFDKPYIARCRHEEIR